MSDIQASVLAAIARIAGPATGTIRPDATLKDLGIPSLDVIEMLFELEDEFDVNLSDRDIDLTTATVADLATAIERGVAAKMPQPSGAQSA